MTHLRKTLSLNCSLFDSDSICIFGIFYFFWGLYILTGTISLMIHFPFVFLGSLLLMLNLCWVFEKLVEDNNRTPFTFNDCV